MDTLHLVEDEVRERLSRNVEDRFKSWLTEDIRAHVQETTFPFAVGVWHIEGDFNLGTVIRNANALGAREIFYFGGKKKYDTRSTVGTRFYSKVTFLPTFVDMLALKDRYTFVALENNINYPTVYLHNFTWPDNPLILVGEEQKGLPKEVLDYCSHFVTIKQFGSVRSFNLGTASGIAMQDLVVKKFI